MFDDLVESSPVNKKKTNQGWTTLISVTVQVLLVLVAILIPLIYTEALPKAMLTTLLVAPPPPPPPPPPPAAQPIQKIVKPTARLMQAGKLMAPKAIPKDINIIKEEELPPDVGAGFVVGGVPGGVPGGQAGGVLGGILGAAPSSAPPPPAPKAATQRTRIGGDVIQASKIRHVQPVYPPLAKQARIFGTVRLQAIIAKDGSIIELQVLSGHALLIRAALDAVGQWRYRPTMLNGEAVEVITTIDVNFALN